MKLRLLTLACTTASLVLAGAASATHDLLEFDSAVSALHQVDPTIDPPPSSGGDFVVGGGQAVGAHLAIAAHGGQSGEDPRGTFRCPGCDGTIVARVTCLAVSLNRAAVGVVVTKSDADSIPGGTELIVRLDDLGRGTADSVSLLAGFATLCVGHLGLPAQIPIEHGNFLVHDEVPAVG
jgi:hypothetical protein